MGTDQAALKLQMDTDLAALRLQMGTDQAALRLQMGTDQAALMLRYHHFASKWFIKKKRFFLKTSLLNWGACYTPINMVTGTCN